MSHSSRPPPPTTYPDDDDDDDRSSQSSVNHAHGQKRQPHYAQPTQAQQLPEYANAEAETIRAAFATGNYRMIAHLPTELKPHHVSEATANRIDDNITSSYFVAPHGTYRKFGSKDALFSTFDYVPEEYSLASKLLSTERKEQEEKRLKVNPLPFLYSTPRPLLINSLAGVARPEENERYAGQDVYESAEEQQRRLQYLDSTKILHGPFVPTIAAHSIGDDKVIRMKLPDIIAKLMKEIDADWGDSSFQIYSDEEDLIIVQFDASTVDNPKGLLAYMNTFVKTNKIVSEYVLAKLVELWNHNAPDGFLYYAFRPPWVKRRADESFFVLHPEMSVMGGKFIEQKQTGLLKSGQKDDRTKGEGLLRLTAGSGASTARSQTGGAGDSSTSAAAAATPSSQPLRSPIAAQSASYQGGSLSGNPPPLPTPLASHQRGGSTANTATMSSDEKDDMDRLMAQFDAGLQVRKSGTLGATTKT